MEFKVGDKVLIKKEFWKIHCAYPPNVPTNMLDTQLSTDIVIHIFDNGRIRLDNTWSYAPEWLVPLDSMDNDKLFELYVEGTITSSEYYTLLNVKEGG